MDKNKARKEYPGAAIDKADNDRVSEKLVKESVKELNNNPRNSDEKMPWVRAQKTKTVRDNSRTVLWLMGL